MTAWLHIVGIGEDGIVGLSAAARAQVEQGSSSAATVTTSSRLMLRRNVSHGRHPLMR